MPAYNTHGNKPKIYPNWMSQVDSPTYKMTLYVVHPDIWNDPTRLANDEPVINGGYAVIVAQSGTTTNYAIDNLVMLSRVTPSNKAGSTTTGILQFDITEPLGFKLLDRILALSSMFGFKNLPSANFVLKVEFQGREPRDSKFTPYPGIFFYPLMISQISANLGPNGARYNVVASNIMKFANAESVVTSDVTVTGVNNVENFTSALSKALNDYEKSLRKVKTGDNPKPKKRWRVKLGDSLSSASPNDETVRAQNWAWAGTTNADKAGGQSASANPDYRDIVINGETNLTSWIRDAITANVPDFAKFSEKHKRKGLKVPYIVVTPDCKFGTEVDPETNMREVDITLVIDIQWTYTNAERDSKKQDKKLRDANFQTDRFQELPISKVYHYLFTGKNTEIMDFDLNFQQLFAVALDPGSGLNYGEAQETHAGTSLNESPVEPSSSIKPLSGNISDKQRITGSKGIRFLSDIKVNQSNLTLETPQYVYSSLSAAKQKVNESKSDTSTFEAIRDSEYSRRDLDFVNIELRIKGDPFWLGTPGAVVTDTGEALVKYLKDDILIIIINYLPDDSITSTTSPKVGAMDMASSGVYRVVEVENKFQGGQFTQKLTAYKDTNTSVYLVRDLMIMKEYNYNE